MTETSLLQLVLKGQAHLDADEPDRAICAFTSAIEQFPTQSRDLILLRASAYIRVEDFPRAEADFTHAIEEIGQIPKLFEARGTVRMKMGKLDEALSDMTIAVDSFPNDPDMLNTKAWLFHLIGQMTFAKRSYDTAELLMLRRELGMFSSFHFACQCHGEGEGEAHDHGTEKLSHFAQNSDWNLAAACRLGLIAKRALLHCQNGDIGHAKADFFEAYFGERAAPSESESESEEEEGETTTTQQIDGEISTSERSTSWTPPRPPTKGLGFGKLKAQLEMLLKTEETETVGIGIRSKIQETVNAILENDANQDVQEALLKVKEVLSEIASE